jgi:hypothetical protein
VTFDGPNSTTSGEEVFAAPVEAGRNAGVQMGTGRGPRSTSSSEILREDMC